MKPTVFVLFLAFLAPLAAADTTDELGRYELVPFGGLRTGGEFGTDDGDIDVDDAATIGLRFNARADYNTQWQIFVSHQSTELQSGGLFAGDDVVDVDVTYLQGGGTYYLDGDTVQPYFAATMGLSRFDPDAPGFDSENFFAVSFAGGLRVLNTERFALSLEARWLGSFIESDSEIFCFTSPENNACLIEVEGELLSQFDLTLGAAFKF